ncbi:hypothetical protein CP978_29085 [Streptomyces nodosus]|uniref:Uncharacterized protein n=1 Tax=Streptomyces nodosus TaxID=40318 RepID=A0A5P2WB93_9ACTN|nr:hypothetical protein CP978_29085 [Streptomyces nodosus]
MPTGTRCATAAAELPAAPMPFRSKSSEQKWGPISGRCPVRAIARRRKVLVAELPGPSGNAASVRAGRRPPGATFVRSSKCSNDLRRWFIEASYKAVPGSRVLGNVQAQGGFFPPARHHAPNQCGPRGCLHRFSVSRGVSSRATIR